MSDAQGFVLGSDGCIRLLRDDDPEAAHEAVRRGRSLSMARPVVTTGGVLFGELLRPEAGTAPVVVDRGGAAGMVTLSFPVGDGVV